MLLLYLYLLPEIFLPWLNQVFTVINISLIRHLPYCLLIWSNLFPFCFLFIVIIVKIYLKKFLTMVDWKCINKISHWLYSVHKMINCKKISFNQKGFLHILIEDKYLWLCWFSEKSNNPWLKKIFYGFTAIWGLFFS